MESPRPRSRWSAVRSTASNACCANICARATRWRSRIPSFPGVLDLLAAGGYGRVPFLVDDEGPVPASVNEAMRRVRALILTPRAQNPTGAALTTGRAAELRRIVRKHAHVLMIENDPAGPVAGTAGDHARRRREALGRHPIDVEVPRTRSPRGRARGRCPDDRPRRRPARARPALGQHDPSAARPPRCGPIRRAAGCWRARRRSTRIAARPCSPRWRDAASWRTADRGSMSGSRCARKPRC